MNATMFVGIGLAFVGFAVFAGALFSSGGVAKSEQFRVMREVLSGQHGADRKRMMSAGLLMAAFGGLTLFAGLAARDAGRAERCRTWCTRQGYPRSVLRRVEEPVASGRPVVYFGCVCERDDGATTRTRANDL